MGPWIGGFVVVVGAGLGAAGLAWLLHDRVPDETRGQFCNRGNQLCYVAGALFAITAGLTAVPAWDDLGAADDTIAEEASATVDLYWYAHSLDEPESGRLEALLRDYAATVVENEWRLMSDDHRLSEQAWRTLDDMRGELGKIEPATTGQSDRYAAALTRAADMADARRERLEQAQAEIPGVVWGVLIVAGLLVVAVPLVFGAPDRFVHAALAFAATAFVAFVLVLLSGINHPYSGSISPFEEAQVGFDRIDAG